MVSAAESALVTWHRSQTSARGYCRPEVRSAPDRISCRLISGPFRIRDREAMSLAIEERLAELGRRLVAREQQYDEALTAAWGCAKSLHARVAEALRHYHATVSPAASRLAVTLSEPRIDDKHLHAVEFELSRGRHRAVVTVKGRGEVTLVGPFKQGKTEGPCRSFPTSAQAEIERAMGDFLCTFIEAAVAP